MIRSWRSPASALMSVVATGSFRYSGFVGVKSGLTQDCAKVGRNPLRCLWITRMNPMSPDAGDLVYSFHLLSSLSRAGAQLTVAAMSRPGTPAPRASENGIEWIVVPSEENQELAGRLAVRSLFSRLPNVASQYNTGSFRRALRVQLAREWDAVIVDHLGMGWAWPAIRAYQRRNPRAVSVFIAHQGEGQVRRSMARNFRGNVVRKVGLTIDALKANRLERRLVRRSDLLSAITAEDLDSFACRRSAVLLTPGYLGLRVASREIGASTPRRALILGNAVWLAKQMNLIEFIEAGDELFYQAQVELWIAGNVAARFRAKNHFRATRFLGYVDNLEPVFRDARIGIVAERTGGGFKLKTLDYIFNRLPIAAINGGIAGLPLTPGRNFLFFASMRELAEGVVRVMDDFERLNALQRAAYERCEVGFDWSDRGRALRDAIHESIARRRAIHA
jgi:glycosyltransferase involved in cell wall biosynthesis